MTILYEKDVDRSFVLGRPVCILGFGAQGEAHARNLSDSGADVVVGLREGSPARARCRAFGLEVRAPRDAVAGSEIVVMLIPDQHQPQVYADVIEPQLVAGGALVFAHGYNIHYQRLVPRDDLDVVLVAPMGIGEQVRKTYEEGGGVPGLIGVHQDASGNARAIALAYASLNGHSRAGIIASSFAEETETDLFAEQVVLCGGITHLVTSAFETLVDAGYNPEIAYFCCLHELKLMADIMHTRGIAGMRRSASNIAEYGDYTRGPRIIDDRTRAEMRQILEEIRNGEFAREIEFEFSHDDPMLRAARSNAVTHKIETIGLRLRTMMGWVDSDNPYGNR